MRDVGALLVVLALGRHDDLHGQPVPLRELEVALVVSRHSHDRARPVLHQDVVGDPDRNALAVDRVRHERARVDPRLLLRRVGALDRGAGRRPADVLQRLFLARRPGDEVGDERVLGRQHEERRPEERVRARREHRDVHLQLVDPEDHLGALGTADPVPLHGQHVLGPGLEQAHLVEEAVGVVGDAEEPLLQVPALDLGAAALAPPVDHLLVREHRLVVRAPVDRRFLPVGEALLVELEEEPLRPAVVGGVGRRDLTIPVDRPPHAAHLLPNRGDVALRHEPRMTALPDRCVLGREPERVVAHRPQHVESHAPADVSEDVAERVVLDVAHVELARGVREHLEDIGVLLVHRHGRGGIRDGESALALPHLLPLQLDRFRVVSLHRAPI